MVPCKTATKLEAISSHGPDDGDEMKTKPLGRLETVDLRSALEQIEDVLGDLEERAGD